MEAQKRAAGVRSCTSLISFCRASTSVESLSLLLIALFLSPGCERAGNKPGVRQVVVYTSIDQQFAQEVLAQFAQKTGIEVLPVYDTEAGKTTGLVRRLYKERESPRCDVWWSSEVFGTIELARHGVLRAYEPRSAADIPAEWNDQQQRWTGLAARARVLAYDPQRMQAADVPRTWGDVSAAPRDWLSRLAIANPQFGTTRGHIAAQFALWGPQQATEWLQRLRDGGAQVVDGNAQAVRSVESGNADWCMTDTDDVWAAQRRGSKMDIAYPIMDETGKALWIPCTVAMVNGGPDEAAARELIEFLVSAEAELALARSDSHNVPVRPVLRAQLQSEENSEQFFSEEPSAMDYEKIADAMGVAMDKARETLIR